MRGAALGPSPAPKFCAVLRDEEKTADDEYAFQGKPVYLYNIYGTTNVLGLLLCVDCIVSQQTTPLLT